MKTDQRTIEGSQNHEDARRFYENTSTDDLKRAFLVNMQIFTEKRVDLIREKLGDSIPKDLTDEEILLSCLATAGFLKGMIEEREGELFGVVINTTVH